MLTILIAVPNQMQFRVRSCHSCVWVHPVMGSNASDPPSVQFCPNNHSLTYTKLAI